MELITEHSWLESRDSINKTDPYLAEIIDEISPSDDLTFIRVRYKYGDYIYKNCQFYLPNRHGSVTLDHNDIAHEIRKKLSYSPPIGCVTHNGFEVYRNINNYIFPLATREQGLELGIWETFLPASPFTVVSGTRSAFLLPKVADKVSHKRLRKLNVKASIPKSLFDQWNIFRDIAQNQQHNPWYCEVYFFTDKWHEKIFSDKKFVFLENYLLRKILKHTQSKHAKITYDSMWENFSVHLKEKGFKVNYEILEIIEQLICIATGLIPGYKVAINDDSLPTELIQRAYLENYGLKNYIPTIMYSSYFDKAKHDSVYYSLQVPTTSSLIPTQNNFNTTKNLLIDLVEVFDIFLAQLSQGKIANEHEYMRELFSSVSLDFYHVDEAPQLGIHPVSDLAADDPDLIKSLVKTQNTEFCSRNTFTRACIRITRK